MFEKIMRLIEEGNFPEIKTALAEMNATDIAALFNELDFEQLPVLYRLLTKELAAGVFIELGVDAQEQLITSLIEERNFPEIKAALIEMNATDIAVLFNELDFEHIPVLYRLLTKELAADTFVELDADMQEHLIASFSDAELKEVLDNLFLDDTVDIIEEMPANVVERLLAQSTPLKRKLINELLKYPEDSAGSIMTIEFVSLKPNMTVREAFEKIRKTGINKETIYTCYVTDPKRVLIGVVTAKLMLLADPENKISDIMEHNVIYAYTTDDQEDVARKISKYGFLAMPIVDNENRLVGIVTVDDAMDIIEEENEEDFSKMAAIAPVEQPYFKTSIIKHAKSRIVWLLILMISATLTGMILDKFEGLLVSVSFLITFIPMLTDTGGNCGCQSSTTVIRGLSLGEIKPRDFIKVMFKESGIGLVCAVILAAANTVRVILMYWWDPSKSHALVLGTCSVLFFTIIGVVVLSKFLGAVLPLLAKKLKLDPALMASPLITTIVDAFAILIFVGIAFLILPMFGFSL